MTIQRKYSLPNCTLLLEGLNDGTNGGPAPEVRPLLSILVNVECYLSAAKQPLVGGRDFFENLVTTVSGYAQEFLSRVHHPEAHSAAGLVQLQKINENRHRLFVHSTEMKDHGLDVKPGSPPHPIQIDLTTVQLFDLVEAVDQFFADSQTLPDLSLQLQPVSKRYGGSTQALLNQAVPAGVGLSTLAVAALAFFLVPAPELRPPEPKSQDSASTTTPGVKGSEQEQQPTTSPTPAPSPPEAESQAVFSTAPEITDDSQLYVLNRELYNQVNQAWNNRSTLTEDLVFRVGVAADGAIVGYRAVNPTANDVVEQTPLPNLLSNPATRSATDEPIAQFRVVFTRKAELQVSPWRGYKGTPKVIGPEITDSGTLRNLNDKLYEQIRSNWSDTPIFRRNLIYRVAVNEQGAISDYEPLNQVAFDYAGQTPLPQMLQQPSNEAPTAAAPAEQPLAQFKVVFKPDGVLEVSPWRGYR